MAEPMAEVPVASENFTCPTCFTVNVGIDEELVGYCYGCFAFTGLSPWEPADGDSKCQMCSRPNAVWWVQSEVWNAVMGSEAGILCPSCFIVRANLSGLARRGAWQLYPPAAS